MVGAFDAVLGLAGTFVEEVAVEGMSQAVFSDKVLGALESCVAAAVAPAGEALGIDCVFGTDMGVPLAVASARRCAALARRGISATSIFSTAVRVGIRLKS